MNIEKGMCTRNPKVLVVATSRKTRGGITSVIKAHETGEQWKKYHCRWIETHIDRNLFYKLFYLFRALIQFVVLAPFYDIIHIHVANNSSVKRKMIFFYLSKLYHKKILIHFHPPSPDVLSFDATKRLYTKLFNRSDCVVVLSNQWKVWINELYSVNKDILVVYNPCPKVDILQTSNKKNYILYAGYVIGRKGYSDLINAFALVANKFPDWSIYLAGTGEIEIGKQLAKNLNIEQQVKFLGWIDGEVKRTIFNEASVFCLPSYGEGFPMAVLDALAYELPVITSPVGGIPDIIHDNVNGLLFEPGDIKGLSEKIDLIISEKLFREEIINQSRKLSKTVFNIESVNTSIEHIYKLLSTNNFHEK